MSGFRLLLFLCVMVAAVGLAVLIAFDVADAYAAPSRAPAAVERAVRQVFGRYADQALRVADCETGGTWSLATRTGQYLGLFQMGEWERATYAHGRYVTVLDQTRAAWRYFVVTGRDWSPWECRP